MWTAAAAEVTQRHHTAGRQTGIGLQGGQGGRRIGDQHRRHPTGRQRLTGRAVRHAGHRSPRGPQCAGTAITTGPGAPPLPTARAIASRASATRTSPRCADPSAATRGTGSPTRSTNPRSTRPDAVMFGLVSSGFCDGTPTSAGRLLPQRQHRSAADRRPARTRRGQIGRPDRQPQRRSAQPFAHPFSASAAVLTIVADCANARQQSPNEAYPLRSDPLMPDVAKWVRHRSRRGLGR